MATHQGHIEAVKILLANERVDVNCQDFSQITPLIMAASRADKIEIAHCCTIFLKSSGYRNIAQGGDPLYAAVDYK